MRLKRPLRNEVYLHADTNIAGVIDEKTDSLTLIQLPNPVPHVDSVTPVTLMRGSIDAKIIISGSKFIKTSTVSIKSDTASYSPIPTFIDNHTLEVAIPGEMLQSTGTYQLTVTSPAPEGGTSDAFGLAVENPVPQISVLDPMEVEAGTHGITLNIFGDGFFEDTTFYIDGIERAVNFIKRSKVEMELMAADLEVGDEIEITAFNPAPGGGTSPPSTFTVLNPVPVLSSITPTEVEINTPVTLTLNGEGFVKTSTVEFNGQSVPVTYMDWNTLQAEIPAVSEAGYHGVKVTSPVPGGGASEAVDLTVKNPVPVLSAITPSEVPSEQDASITITGNGFVQGSVIRMDGNDLPTTFIDSGSLSATVTGALLTAGEHQITVFSPVPGGGKSEVLYLKVTGVKPQIDWASGAPGYTWITLYVRNFDDSTIIYVNGQPKTTQYNAPMQIAWAILYPEILTAGTYEIVAVNGSGIKSDPYYLTVKNPMPTLSGILPQEINAGSDPVELKINGYNFIQESIVTIGGHTFEGTYVSRYLLKVALPLSIMENPGAYAVTVTNPSPGGGESGSLTLTVLPPAPFDITSPLNGTTLRASKVLVKGTYDVQGEVGITVNGFIADIYGNEWVANDVPLERGQNTIEVILTEADGTVYKKTIMVSVTDTLQHVELSSSTTSGLAPLTVDFSVSSAPYYPPVRNYQIDYEGDGIVDYTGAIFNGVNFTYNTEGIYYPTVTVTDSRGYTYSDTIAVTVLSMAKLDALLKGKWDGMKAALAGGNLQNALGFIHAEKKEMYSYNFNLLSPVMAEVLQGFGNIHLVEIEDGIAEYEMLRMENGEEYSYYVEFVRGKGGIWKLSFF